MGLFDLLFGWLLPKPPSPVAPVPQSSPENAGTRTVPDAVPHTSHRGARLAPLRRRRIRRRELPPAPTSATRPYRFATPSASPQSLGAFLDLTQDGSDAELANLGLPRFHTPEELAAWLQIPLGHLVWLTHHLENNRRARDEAGAHYRYRWIPKRSGGKRLLEIPKKRLRHVQRRILRDILDQVAPHSAAHGFAKNRSVLTNAQPHVGKAVLLKFDLENFYPTVGFARVVAIFRSLGYCREAALWLARLTTTSAPDNVGASFNTTAWHPYSRRHLPQGACTSPALANFSAFELDLRLAGLARTFHASYTRYADDLTFSGDRSFLRSLRTFIPLVQRIIKCERFKINKAKRRVIRANQRQSVTGVVVNERINVSRKDFDNLKATLHNCVKLGPASQNHDKHADFAAHLRGRISHVALLNQHRGDALMLIFEKIRW